MELPPPRIHVLLARRAPVGLVIRRGPSKLTAAILWDRRSDEFHLGQWMKGRIYERRCDLSPDGTHLLYFAMNGRWDSEARGAWTGISRAPYLKALALFAKGDCWQGGGLWTDERAYWLNGAHAVVRDATCFRRDPAHQPPANFGAECLGVYFPRLLRDGWTLVDRGRPLHWDELDLFDKPLAHGWLLRKIAHIGSGRGKSCYWDEHELLHPATGGRIPCPAWEWADLDGDRLAWAAQGRLLCAAVGPDGPANEKELFDFNPMEFTPVEAPY